MIPVAFFMWVIFMFGVIAFQTWDSRNLKKFNEAIDQMEKEDARRERLINSIVPPYVRENRKYTLQIDSERKPNVFQYTTKLLPYKDNLDDEG